MPASPLLVPPPWNNTLCWGVGMAAHRPPSSRRLGWWGLRTRWVWLWGCLGSVSPPHLWWMACKVCCPIFSGSPPWSQFVRYIGGRGKVPVRGRLTSGSNHLTAPQICGVGSRRVPHLPGWRSPTYFHPSCACRRAWGVLESSRPEAKFWPGIPPYISLVKGLDRGYPCAGVTVQLGCISLVAGMGVVVAFFLRRPQRYLLSKYQGGGGL